MMFKGSASKLNFEPKEGDEVLLEDESLFMSVEVTIKFMLIRCSWME